MKRKRLDRDLWGFQNFPYYQMRIDCDFFHGTAALIKLTSGDYFYWNMPTAGKSAVCGKGMLWLQLIPDNQKRLITVKYIPKKRVINDREYKYSVSVWYVDVIERIEYDSDGVAAYVDKYLDVIFNTCGDYKLDDMDELEAAYKSGELSEIKYLEAIREGEAVTSELCSDTAKTELWCYNILDIVEQRIAAGEKPFKKSY